MPKRLSEKIDSKVLHVRILETTYHKLHLIAKREGWTVSELVRALIKKYLGDSDTRA